jgi:hypothetical protein
LVLAPPSEALLSVELVLSALVVVVLETTVVHGSGLNSNFKRDSKAKFGSLLKEE